MTVDPSRNQGHGSGLPGAVDITELPAPLAAAAANAWQRVLDASQSIAVDVPPRARLRELPRILAQSPFVAEFAVRHAGEFWELLRGGLSAAHRPNSLEQRLDAIFRSAPDEHELRAALRRLRNLEMVRIIWRDLAGHAQLSETVADVTRLADSVLRGATLWLSEAAKARYGTPRDAAGREQKLLVVGMGKLGGEELNLSSDIDVIFCYPSMGASDGAKSIDNQSYFDRLCKKLIALLNDVTEDGFVFRVDTRLRPFGDSGPLSLTLSALEYYYQTHGRDWERYAAVKARALTGAPRDIERLTELLRPFVFRRYLDFGALAQVRAMKTLIEDEMGREDLSDDLKRGPGGIREIEFIVQTFQLIRGGREPRLRGRRLLPALHALGQLRILTPETVAQLEAAYQFLRNAEHRLQAMRDQQTQRLPQDGLDRLRLACGMGYADWDSFRAALDGHRAAVIAHFRDLLRVPAKKFVRARDPLSAVWLGSASEMEQLAALEAAGLDRPRDVAAALGILRNSRLIARLTREARERVDTLVPLMLKEIGRRPHSQAVLDKCIALVRATAQRSVYLTMLSEHPAALSRLLDLFAASPWIAEQMIQQPALLDELLDPRTLFAPLTAEALSAELKRMLACHSADNAEQNMEALRAFRHQQVLRVAASDIMGLFPIAEVSNHLSYIAEACIAGALEIAWRDVADKLGVPYCLDDGAERPAGFAVIAYGKLGGLELSYRSDLDLVFVHDSAGEQQATRGAKSVHNQVFFTRLAQRLIHLLTTPTAGGIVYEIDVRLRPSGASGLIVTSLEAFAEYQARSAWTWEHQALVRARFVAGDPCVRSGFERIRAEVLRRRRDPVGLAKDVREMRAKMLRENKPPPAGRFDIKRGEGGITDIEFMVQYAVLRWAHDYPDLVEFTDNLRLLARIEHNGCLAPETCRQLHEAYFTLRREIHRLALLDEPALVDGERFAAERAAVRRWWRAVFESDAEHCA